MKFTSDTDRTKLNAIICFERIAGGEFTRYAECDRCHAETMVLEDEASEGGFEYCKSCWRKYAGIKIEGQRRIV